MGVYNIAKNGSPWEIEWWPIVGKNFFNYELFWQISCYPCVAEMPGLNKLVNKYKSKGVTFLAPTAETKEKVNTFLKDHSFLYQILPNSSEIEKLYGISSWPVHVIINPEGIIEFVESGGSQNRLQDLEMVLENLLK